MTGQEPVIPNSLHQWPQTRVLTAKTTSAGISHPTLSLSHAFPTFSPFIPYPIFHLSLNFQHSPNHLWALCLSYQKKHLALQPHLTHTSPSCPTPHPSVQFTEHASTFFGGRTFEQWTPAYYLELSSGVGHNNASIGIGMSMLLFLPCFVGHPYFALNLLTKAEQLIWNGGYTLSFCNVCRRYF